MRTFLSKVADYFRETDKLLLLLCIISSLFGSAMILSAMRYTGSVRIFWVQILCSFLGLAAAIIVSGFIDYSVLLKFCPLIAAVALGLVGLTFFIGYAPSGTDDKAWLALPGNMSLQPSELLKIAFIITFAKHVSVVEHKINRFYNVVLLAAHGAVPVVIIHIQGDDGTALVLASIFVAMMFAAGIQLRYFFIAFAVAAAAIPSMWYFVFNDDQRSRFISIFNPEADLYGAGWQQWRGRLALANGGIWGKGYMRGDFVQAGQIPEQQNDFIFATIGEELGMIGLLCVMLLIGAMCVRILFIAQKSRDKAGAIICTGVFAMFAAQSFINIGMCTSLFPVVGVTLPFFSSGGTSLICNCLGIGLAVNVYMHRNRQVTYLRDVL